MHGSGAVGSNGGDEVLGFEAMRYIIQLLTVASEEDGARAGTVADANDIALDNLGSVGGGIKGLVIPANTAREVSDGRLVVACSAVLVAVG